MAEVITVELSIAFLVFVTIFLLGVFQFARALKKKGVKNMLLTTAIFCAVNLLTLFITVWWIYDLEAFLLLYVASIALLLFSMISVLILFYHYFVNQETEKIWVGLAMSCLPIFSIVLIWIVVSAQGPIKFWG